MCQHITIGGHFLSILMFRRENRKHIGLFWSCEFMRHFSYPPGLAMLVFNGQRNVLVYSNSVLAFNVFFFLILYKSRPINGQVTTLLQVPETKNCPTKRTWTFPDAAANWHTERRDEASSTFTSCIFNTRLYKRCRTEPGVYESIEQRVMAAEGRLQARLNFPLLNVNEVRPKVRSARLCVE